MTHTDSWWPESYHRPRLRLRESHLLGLSEHHRLGLGEDYRLGLSKAHLLGLSEHHRLRLGEGHRLGLGKAHLLGLSEHHRLWLREGYRLRLSKAHRLGLGELRLPKGDRLSEPSLLDGCETLLNGHADRLLKGHRLLKGRRVLLGSLLAPGEAIETGVGLIHHLQNLYDQSQYRRHQVLTTTGGARRWTERPLNQRGSCEILIW